MRNIVLFVAPLSLAACGLETPDPTELSSEELESRPPTGSINFGDDGGDWANDGECDDPRFRGPGMTTTPLLDEDIMADATDCRSAYNRGELTLIE
ncbi:MAG: hypothetical protein AAF697_05285 [Pseudomonadota bacterium]